MLRRRALLTAPLLPLAAVTGCAGGPAPEPAAQPLTVKVFLARDATDAQREGVDAALRGRPEAGRSVYVSPEQALAAFRREHAEAPGTLDSLAVGDLPASFVVELADRATLDGFAAAIRPLPGVDAVTPQRLGYDEVVRRSVG